jgi:steroid 5-alpha reductase family enzyme
MVLEDVFFYLALSLGINLSLFLLAYVRRSDKLTDFSYALSFAVIAITTYIRSDQRLYHTVLLTLVLLWAARLGTFLVYRIRKSGTDHRFDGVRENFVRFGKFWLGQAIAAWVIMLPSIFASATDTGMSTLAVGGALIWLAGFWIELLADLQKIIFKNNPKNKDKWIELGLWRYSRHPNYFGEILVWTGVYLYAFTALSLTQAVVAFASPAIITSILLFVSGIPPLEEYADRKWGKLKAYQEYKQRTSLLVLWPPKKQ